MQNNQTSNGKYIQVQGIVTKQQVSTRNQEKIVCNCNSMSDLRFKARTYPNVEEEFKSCLKNVITTLESQFEMIQSGGEGYVTVERPACNIYDVEFLQHHLCHTTDYRLDVTTTKEANKLPVFLKYSTVTT